MAQASSDKKEKILSEDNFNMLFDRLFGKGRHHSEATDFSYVFSKLKHYMGIPDHRIQNYTFSKNVGSEIFDQFNKWETEWKERQSQFIPYDPDDGEVIMKFPNNWEWVLLSRGFCRAEGDAMGHCGNQGAHYGDRIISLRQQLQENGETVWRPSLTFILNQDGKLGEMKGRNNNKPDAKYHPYIIALLKNDIIQGIRGGGYKPQNNFSMNDLTEEQQEALVNEKPELASVLYQYKRFGLTDKVMKEFIDTMKQYHQKVYGFSEDKKTVYIQKYKNRAELVEELGNDLAKNWQEKFENGNIDISSHGMSISDFINDLSTSQINILIDYVKNNEAEELLSWYQDEVDDEAENVSDINMDEDDLTKYLDYSQNEIYDGINSALYSGVERGIENEAYEALQNAIDGPVFDTDSELNNYLSLIVGASYDDPSYLAVTLEALLGIMESEDSMDNGDNFSVSDVIQMEEPYYGFSGFDMEAAVESFESNTGIDLNPKPKQDMAA